MGTITLKMVEKEWDPKGAREGPCWREERVVSFWAVSKKVSLEKRF